MRLRSTIALFCSLVAACSSVPVSRSPDPAVPSQPVGIADIPAAPPAYTLQAGDLIDVKLYYHPDLNESALVLPDGKITLQLIGEVPAQGSTPDGLAKSLVERYVRAGLRNPQVAVMLRKSGGQRVFVGGEVNTPRMVPYEGRLTLSQAIFEAGGFKTSARPQSIVLLRNNGQAKASSIVVDFEKDILHEKRDIPLQPYDVIVVPKSTIATVNQFVEQYVSKMVPTWMTFGFSYIVGASAVVE